MGNRVNYVFLPNENDDYEAVTVLYAHSAINNGTVELAIALDKARPRWSDSSYGQRMIISQIVGTDWDSEYGYGLYSLKEYDSNMGMWNDNPDILISLSKQEVCIEGKWHSFDSFVEYHQEVMEFHDV